jgi:hypothetical protein
MCVVSAVIDHKTRQWPEVYPNVWPVVNPITPNVYPSGVAQRDSTTIKLDALREEVKELRAQVEFLLELIPTLKKYDEDNEEPNCEMDEKVELIRNLCEMLGIDNDVL